MKLELKHLAPYLPYNLNTKYLLYNVIGEIGEIAPQKNEVRDKKLTAENVDFVLEYCKPLLRPLSDLNKEIECDGIIFNPIETYAGMSQLKECVTLSTHELRYAHYSTVEFLFEHHFDVFGLIEKGLAIDINTIDK